MLFKSSLTGIPASALMPYSPLAHTANTSHVASHCILSKMQTSLYGIWWSFWTVPNLPLNSLLYCLPPCSTTLDSFSSWNMCASSHPKVNSSCYYLCLECSAHHVSSHGEFLLVTRKSASVTSSQGGCFWLFHVSLPIPQYPIIARKIYCTCGPSLHLKLYFS